MISRPRKDFVHLIAVYAGALLSVFLLSYVANPVFVTNLGIIGSKEKSSQDVLFNGDAFKNISVKARAYVIYDIVEKRIIASKNENEVLPLASITKIMMAVTALAKHAASTTVTIDPKSLDGDYDLGLKKDQSWRLSELLKYTLVLSSNDGAEEIASTFGGKEAFVSQMNEEAKALGLSLLFTDPAGLDVGNKIGGTGSALEVAKLFAIARKQFPEVLDATTKSRTTLISNTTKIIGIPNTNQDIGTFFGAEASKTGFTNSAGGNLAVIVDVSLGHPVVIVVLGSTYEERFKDIEILYEALRKSLEN